MISDTAPGEKEGKKKSVFDDDTPADFGEPNARAEGKKEAF